jgi:O-antigen/teichoic acid export membrane protein
MTLRKKIVHGAMWYLLEKAGNQGILFIVFMFVARLIGSKEYGLGNLFCIFFASVVSKKPIYAARAL